MEQVEKPAAAVPVKKKSRKGWIFAVLADLFFALWCCGAIWFQRWITGEPVKLALVLLFILITLVLAIGSFRKKYLLCGSFLLSLGVAVPWCILLQPTGVRDWQISCSRIPTVKFSQDGKSVTIGNIRDFHYRSTTDFDVRYRTETYRLKDLRTMDYAITHWMGKDDLIGHVILTFGFADGRYLAVSGETRIGERDSKSLLAGIFRQYELIYIVGTEEDLLQLRTNHRNQRVYLFPANVKPENIPPFFADLMQRAADLGPHPQFYNTLSYNCTNSLTDSSRKVGSDFGSGLSGIINGVFDFWGFHTGMLTGRRGNESFAEYKWRHLTNQYVAGLKDPPDYSRRIRAERNNLVQSNPNPGR